MKIKASMTIKDILEKAPHSIAILMEAGLGCIGCHLAALETLEEGCKAHGLSDEDIDKLVEKINKK